MVFPHRVRRFKTSSTPAKPIQGAIALTRESRDADSPASPAGAQYWKYRPTPSIPTASWYALPATITGNTAGFSITDGQLGADDLAANGTIVDQGGSGIPPGGIGAASIATLSQWALTMGQCRPSRSRR